MRRCGPLEITTMYMKSGCLKTVVSERIRVSSALEMETRVSESEAGNMELNGRECEEVEASVSKVKAEGLRFIGGNDNIVGGNGGMGNSMDGSEEVRVSSELDRGGIKRKTESRGLQIKPTNLHFDDANYGTDRSMVSSEEAKVSSGLGSNEIQRKIEARLSDLKDDDDLDISVRSDNFDVGNESALSHRGRESDMEVVEGQNGYGLNYSYLVPYDASTVETSEIMELDAAKVLSYGFEPGDMVWGKVKSHPWWPGHIFNEAFATSSVRRTRREGHVLVAFFGDSSYGWFDPAELVSFEPNYAEKSRQTNSRNFVKSVEEAVDEASRRSALGLACRCQNPFNFRPTSVQGYFAVDVLDYESGGVYSSKQIQKARDSFRPAEALTFVQQLALMPRDGEDRSIDWIKNVAVVLAYRKAVFEEFDETYAQAFGMEPVRPSRNAFGALEQPDKVPTRAPLSGPLVIAEALGERKSSGKSLKAKDSSKKDKYLFKRRDEPIEKRSAKQEPHHSSQLQANAIPSLALKEASGNFPSRAGVYVSQKRAPAVPEIHLIPAKQEQREIVSQGYGSPITKIDSIQSQGWADFPAVRPVDIPTSQSPVYGLLSIQGGSEEGKLPTVPVAEEMDASPEMTKRLKLEETVGTTSTATDLEKAESLGAADGVGRAVRQEVEAVLVEGSREQDQVMEHSHIGSFSVSADGLLPGEVVGTSSVDVVVGRTTKSLKRPIGEDLSSEKYVMGEKKKKKKKKKDSGLETSLDHRQKRPKVAKDGEALRNLAGKSIGIGSDSQEHLVIDSERKDGISSDFTPLLSNLDIGNVELELSQLVNDLLALALDPFHAIERNSPAIVRHVFLKFRSLVYQKSLVLPPASETEAPERVTMKPVLGRSLQELSIENTELASTADGKDASASKSLKHSSRLDDPTKMGRKRSPSDRQEEMSVKRLKKVNELKQLTMEKKVSSQKTPDGQKVEQKEIGTVALAKPSKTDPVKKPGLPARATKPTALVMKFQPKTALPSEPQLKARFARFGPLDISLTRVYWKSSTCRVVFKYQSDAQTAFNYASKSSLFGQMKVRYNLRELDVPASESSEMNRRRVEDSPDDALPSRTSSDFVGELRAMANQHRQPAVQLKSCLKKPSGDEAGPAVGITKESPRVKFLLGGEGSRGEQMVVVSSSKIGSSADEGPTSSMAFDVNTNNIKTTVIPLLPPLLPLPSRYPDLRSPPRPPPPPLSFLHQPSRTKDVLPSLPLRPPPSFSHASDAHESRSHYSKAPLHAHDAQHKEVEGRKENVIDISHKMMSLLMRCSDIVADVKSALGYVPYYPL